MDFNSLVEYIKSEGCRVRLYKKKKYIHGTAVGTFDVTDNGPIIVMALKDESAIKLAGTLLHEYGHFLQWQDGFLPTIEAICDPYSLLHYWLRGKDYTNAELETGRNAMLAIEWDAEIRGNQLGLDLEIDGFNSDKYMRMAIGYMLGIKYSWKKRVDWKRSIPQKYITLEDWSTEKLFSPLTKNEQSLCKKKLRLFNP